MTDERIRAERMADGFSDAERDEHEALERTLRLRERRQSPAPLRVHVDESLMTSPNGAFSDEELAVMERQHRESEERYRRG